MVARLGLFELATNKLLHFSTIILMVGLGVYSSPVEPLTYIHDNSEAHLPLHLLLGYASTYRAAQCRRISRCLLGSSIDQHLVLVRSVALASQFISH